MRKILVILLLLFIMPCVAFAEGDPVDPTDDPLVEASGEPAEEPTEDPAEEPTVEPVAFDLNKVGISLKQTVFYKTGSAIKPTPVLTYDGAPIDTELFPYSLAYSNNINVGKATVTAAFESGSKSINFEIIPAKPGNTAITAVQNAKPNVIVTWNKVNCTGYALELSSASNFANPVKYWLTANTLSVGKLLDSKVYYFRVRPYNKEQGKTTYGNWSTRSSKVSTTGPVGDRYSLNGELIKNRTIKVGENYFYYNTSGVKSGCAKKMWDKVKNAKSKTKYLIAVDCTKNRTCIYQGKKGKWTLKYYWKCTTGAKNMPTVKGSFKVKKKVSHFGEPKGYTCWHATGFKGEYYFHSVLYKKYSKTKIKDGRLGMKLSHGCIRLAKKNAKWIYKRCKKGTKVIIY